MGTTYEKVSMLNLCRFCGNVWICDTHIRCPYCNGGNYLNVPFEENDNFNFTRLERIGFKYLRKCLNIGGAMLSEFEIRNIVEKERMYMEQIVDPAERKVAGAFIAGLECVLND